MKKYVTLALILFLCLNLWLPAVHAAEEEENQDENGTEEERVEIDKSRFQPSLVIENISAEEAVAGGEFYLSLVVRNWSKSPAFNVYPELKVVDTDGMAPFSFKDGAEAPTLQKIEGEEARTITIGLAVDPEAISKDYKLQITLRNQNAFFEDAPTAGALITIPVKYDRTKPQLLVSNVRLDPQEPAPGEAFTVYFFLENTSRIDANNVVVSLDGLENFTVLDVSSKKALSKPIPGGKVSSGIGFTLQAREEREGNQVELTLTYSYHGAQDAEQVERVTLPLDREAGASPRLEFTDIYTSQSTPGREFLLSFTLVNRGDKAAQNIKLTLDGGNNILPLNSPSVRYLEPLAGGESRTLSLALGLNRADTTVYPLTLTLEYSDRSGQKFTAEQTLGLSSADIGATGSTPRVIISKYTLTPEQVFGGSLVTLALEIENTNLKPVHNVKISLGVVRLENERGDTVFSPVNSSNSFYLDYIPGKNVVTKEIDLFVDPNAGARTYIVPVTIEYEDDSGNPLTVEEMVTIPVTQESRMEVITVDIPPQAFAGQPVPIGAEFVNVGKVALDNFMVALEGDFPKENASYYVGRLEPGMSDYFQGLAFPAGDGILEGRIVFSYIDGSNQEVRREEPFSIPVMAMMEDPAMVDGEFPPDMNGPGTGMGTGLSTGQSLLLLALMAVGAFIYKRRLNAREKEKELFYE
ncbi:MAG: hypothetical protein WBK02_09400 [bacterium]